MLGQVEISDFTDPYSQAIRDQQQKLLQKNNSIQDLNFYASLLLSDGRYEEAAQWLERSQSRYPFDRGALYLKSLLLLLDGYYEEGFQLHEHRFSLYPEKRRLKSVPQWDGQSTDKTVIIWSEGGYGDAIQMIRYWPEVKRRAPNAVLWTDGGLIGLLCYNGVDHFCYGISAADEKTLCHNGGQQCSILSLPLVLGVPLSGAPYLKAPPSAYWAQRMEPNRRKIGLCWRGTPLHERDVTRSMPGRVALKLGELGDFLSLQQEDLNVVNWADTATVISHLDLVISVDTAVAHLAAAMGKPTWIMLPRDVDWRWGKSGERTHWYDNAWLFRCPRHGDWDAVINDIKQALEWRVKERAQLKAS